MKTRGEKLIKEFEKRRKELSNHNIIAHSNLYETVKEQLHSKWNKEDAKKLAARELLEQIYLEIQRLGRKK